MAQRIAALSLMLIVALLQPPLTGSAAPAAGAFDRLWQQTDLAVVRGVSGDSWLWGPAPLAADHEEWYLQSPGEARLVRYYDKGRMELTDPAANPADPWFVTGGLLTRDMIDGRLQVGNNQFIDLAPAAVPVAGDPLAGFPTYADLRAVVRQPARLRMSQPVQQRLTPQGLIAYTPVRGLDGSRIAVEVPGFYGVPAVFWQFMSGSGIIYRDGAFRTVTPHFDWLAVIGYPLSDAFWVRVPVAGVQRDVLVQPFERRLLTYTPDNPPAFQVEMGNVGLHYRRWRYELPFAGGRRAQITAPVAAATVRSPLTVTGLEDGSAFEARIGVRLRLADGTVLVEQGTQVRRPDYGIGGPFSLVLTFHAPRTTTAGTLDVLHYSAEDGSVRVIAEIPVTVAGALSSDDAGLVQLARDDLAARLGDFSSELRVIADSPVSWPDSGLGCTGVGNASLPVVTPGRQVVLEAGGLRYDYRADLSGRWLLCQAGTPSAAINSTLREPAAGISVTLPLFVEAAVGEPGRQLAVGLRFADGRSVTTNVTTLDDGRDGSVLLAGLWPTADAPTTAQRALLEVRDAGGMLLAAQWLQFVPPGSSATRTISLTWLSGEQLVTEQRVIPATTRIGTAALEALLWGPPPQSGYSSALPTPAQVLAYPGRTDGWGARVRLNSLVIRDGVATADFSTELNAYGGGSLRVWGISQQIRTTLLQFPTIREVVIAIDGRSGDVLQP